MTKPKIDGYNPENIRDLAGFDLAGFDLVKKKTGKYFEENFSETKLPPDNKQAADIQTPSPRLGK